jgi:hypothetical protein
MVSNQPPPFPAFAGANPEVAEDPNDQVIVEADETDQTGVTSGLDDAFANLTPDPIEE